MSGGRPICGFLLVLVPGLSLWWHSTSADAQQLSDYQVKAAYFYNFAKFVQWPQRQLSEPVTPIRFCILKDRLFETELNRIVKGKSISGRAIEVVQLNDPVQSLNCSALFINAVQEKESKHLMEILRGSSVLTVGETEEFLQDGGIIAFVLEKDRVQFEVNRRAATDAGLYVSSKMLSLAKKVVN